MATCWPVAGIELVTLRCVFALAFLVSFTVDAHGQARVPRIGIMAPGSPDASAPFIEAFRERLSELGYAEGRNAVIEIRYPGGHADAYQHDALRLIALDVDVIVASNTASTRAAKAQTAKIPIVMAGVGDAVGTGLVKSLSRPGGNVTGQSFFGPQLHQKAFELLTEAVPAAKRIATLYDPELVLRDPPNFQPLIDVARGKGISLTAMRLRRADDVGSILAKTQQPLPDALVVVPVNVAEQSKIASFAVTHRIAVISLSQEAVAAGGLMSYGPNFVAAWKGAANFVDKILKGAKPSDLPVEQPTSFDLVVNLRTAKTLGITFVPVFLARATRTIE